MKALLAATSLLVAASFYAVPTYALDPTAGVSPPECALPDTKTKHPSWYWDGGYCSPVDGEQPGTTYGPLHHAP